MQYVVYTKFKSGGSKGGARTHPPGPNSFNFMQFLGNFAKIVCWRPPSRELAPPPRGNPGSATGSGHLRSRQTFLFHQYVALACTTSLCCAKFWALRGWINFCHRVYRIPGIVYNFLRENVNFDFPAQRYVLIVTNVLVTFHIPRK